MDSNGLAACRLLERLSKTPQICFTVSAQEGESKNTKNNRCNKRFPSNDLCAPQILGRKDSIL